MPTAHSLLLACMLSATPRPGSLPDDTVALVGDYKLGQELFEGFWDALPPARRAGYEAAGGKRAFLDDLVKQKILVAEAEKRGFHRRPDTRVALELAHDQILYRMILDEEVTRRIVTDAALKAYYEEHTDGYRTPEMARIRHILVTPYKDANIANTAGDDATSAEQAEAKVERIRKRLAEGADFAELARELSEDRSTKDGGLLDTVTRGQMSKPIDDAAFSLEPGKVSDVLRTPYGLHIIRVEERIPSRLPPLEEVRDRVGRAVMDEKKDDFLPRLEDLVKELRETTPVTINEKLFPPQAARGPASPAPAKGAGSP